MNRRRWFIVSLVVLVLLVAVGVTYAQNGAGQGPNGPGQGGYGQGSNGPNQAGYGQGNGQQGPPEGAGPNNQRGQFGGTVPGTGLPPAVEGELPAEILDVLNAGIMDEYNAYATYQAVIDQLGSIRPFVNIQAAEAQHIAAWKVIFTRYGVGIPAAPALESVLQFTSRAEACQVAMDAEIANFEMYDRALETVEDYPDIVQVLTSLRDASQYQHLPAFESCAS